MYIDSYAREFTSRFFNYFMGICESHNWSISIHFSDEDDAPLDGVRIEISSFDTDGCPICNQTTYFLNDIKSIKGLDAFIDAELHRMIPALLKS